MGIFANVYWYIFYIILNVKKNINPIILIFIRDYKTQLLKVNLFDEYIQLRTKELVEQNEYLFEHEGKINFQKLNENKLIKKMKYLNNLNKFIIDFKRFIWWFEDFKETLTRVHREANNHDSADFKDSELILQDFIRRYTNPLAQVPLDIRERAAFL